MTPRRGDGHETLEDADRIARLDAALQSGIERVLNDHEGRIREMERWQWKMTGIGVCVAMLVTVVSTVTAYVITDDVRQIRQQLIIAPRR